MENNEKLDEEIIKENSELKYQAPLKNNKKRNIVAYVFLGLTIPLGFITLLFLDAASKLIRAEPQEVGGFAEAFGTALGTAIAVVVAILFAIMAGIAAFVFGIVSISILSTCIKRTDKKRKIANIVILSIVGAVLASIIIGMILVLFVFPNMGSQASMALML